jgi:hypothetical protein
MAAKRLVNMTQTIATEGINQTTISTITATGNSREFYEFASADAAVFYVDCSATSGTNPTLTLVLQERDPATGLFFAATDAPAFAVVNTASIGTPSRYVLNPCYGEAYVLNWAIGGTGSPSLTVSVVAQLISWGK